MKRYLLFLISTIVAYSSFAHNVVEPDTRSHPEWSKPLPPFRIAGNLYYVGTADLACYLIVTSKGIILINTGLASSAQLIQENIKTLGFRVADIKILLTTQAHFDHLGAIAAIKKLTGAKMMADFADAGVIADGGRSDYDPKGDVCVFAPVKVDQLLYDHDTIKLGNMKPTLLHHPGHTKGSCSYLFDVQDQQRIYRVLIANMPTIVTEREFSAVTTYPKIASDYEQTINAMQHIQFDIWLASHGVQFDLLNKYKTGSIYDPLIFSDKKDYFEQLDELKSDYLKKAGK